MIAREQQDHEVRQAILRQELVVLSEELPDAVHVGHRLREPDEGGADEPLQAIDLRGRRDLELARSLQPILVEVAPRRAALDVGLHELAVDPHRLAVGQGVVPNEPSRRIGHRVSAIVGIRPGPAPEPLLNVVCRVARVRPLVSVRRQGSAAVEVVQKRELPCQGVMVRRDLLTVLTECRVPVALGHIAQHLVIRPVLLDDVDDVFERRRLPVPLGQRNGRDAGSGRPEVGQGRRHAVVFQRPSRE